MREQQTEAIQKEKYFEILSALPVGCVDTITFRIRNGKPEVLLVKRAQPPAKDCLYPVGKGLKKNTFSDDWAVQVILKETNMKAKVIRSFGLYEVIYSVGQAPEVKNGLHNPCIAYLMEVSGVDIALDSTHSAARWVTQKDIENGLPLPPYSRTLIEDSEIFSRKISELSKSGTFHHLFLDYRETDFSKFVVD